MRLALTLSCLSALGATSALAEDRLVSRRLQDHGLMKRQEDSSNFNISLFHINDIHAHLDEITSSGTDCVPATAKIPCLGGYARIKAAVDKGRSEVNNSLFLDAGDEFQGTLFYSFYGGEKIGDAMNAVKPDAFTLGNHEFDAGEKVLGEFLQNLTMPVVCANVQSSESNVNKTVKPYHVFPEHKLALVAVTTDTIPSISNPDDGTTFSDPISTTQYWVDYIHANEKDVDRVVLMTHTGYSVDIEIAKQTTGVYIIVGAHSHTLLLGEPKKKDDGTWDNTGDTANKALGSYPTIIENKDGEEVFVVTSYRYGEYLGHISLEFDSEGKVLSYVGAPIHLVSEAATNNQTVYNATLSTAQDTELQKEIKDWRGPFEEYASVVLGYTDVVLEQSTCQEEECTLGDYVCDAMLDARTSTGSNVSSCIINAGGIRATIDAGNITRGQVLTAFPFGNTITELKFSGEDLWKIWEGVVSDVSQFNNVKLTSFAQTSRGTRVTYNPSLDPGSRLINLEFASNPNDTSTFTAVDPNTTYTIVTLDFIAGGGDNIIPIQTNFVSLQTAAEILDAYIAKTSPVNITVEGRLVTTEATDSAASEGGDGGDGAGVLTAMNVWLSAALGTMMGFVNLL